MKKNCIIFLKNDENSFLIQKLFFNKVKFKVGSALENRFCFRSYQFLNALNFESDNSKHFLSDRIKLN